MTTNEPQHPRDETAPDEPVVRAVSVAAAVLVVLHIVLDRFINPADNEEVWNAVALALDVIVPLIAAWWARQQVTPLSSLPGRRR